MNDQLIAKIQKLLSLAQSDNENEAKAASAKASELMLKYNLDMQSVADTGLEFDMEFVKTGSKVSMESKLIIPLLCDAFLVKNIITSKRERCAKSGRLKIMRNQTFVGDRTTLKVVGYTYDFLMRSYKEQFKIYSKSVDYVNKSTRMSFYYGITTGLENQFKTVKEKVGSERGLVVREDPRLKKYYDAQFPNTSNYGGSIKGNIDPSAYVSGVHTGANMKIHRGIETTSTNSQRFLGGK